MWGFSEISIKAPYNVNKYVINAIFLIGSFICFAIFFIQRNLENKVLSKPIYIVESQQKKKKGKKKVSFSEGFAYMMKSRLLLHISGIVLAYNICTNLIDTIFKVAMKAEAVEYNKPVATHVMRTQAWNQMAIAVLVIIILATPLARCVQVFGWAIVGFVTPIWAAITTVLVLFLSIYNTSVKGQNAWEFLNKWFEGKTLHVTYEKILGQISSGGFKVFKYAFFDIAKEAISMRIPQSDRATFKGVYDGICGKLGKSGGSVIQMVLNAISNTVDLRSAAQYCFGIILLFVVFWLNSGRYLGNKYNDSIQNNMDIDLDMAKKKEVPAY